MVADYRQISQEYAKEAIKAALLINGAAAVSLLTQSTKLIEQGLADEAAGAMIWWASGVLLAAMTWLLAFLSTRYVDKSERENNSSRHMAVSNRYMMTAGALVLFSMICFMVGCALLARGFLSVQVP